MKSTTVAIVIFLLFVLFGMSAYVVREDQYAIVFRLGKIQSSNVKPGLHFKWPFVNNVQKFDARLLSLDTQPERFMTSEKTDVHVDSVVKWKIADAGAFYTATQGDLERANRNLSQIIKDRLRDQFNQRKLNDLIATERDQTMDDVRDKADIAARSMGIHVVDVRVKRIELPENLTQSVYKRMESERAQVANDRRSRGQELATTLRAEADRKRQVLLAEAESAAQKIRGEGDAESARIYANAYGKDPEFYSFYRSLEAYRETFKNGSDVMVLDPNSEFFEYFGKQRRQ
jgi:modulator of FtsH protease HflC